MTGYRTWKRAVVGTAGRAVLTYLVLVFFWRALLSLTLVVAVALAALAAAVAVGAGVAAVVRALLLRRRGW